MSKSGGSVFYIEIRLIKFKLVVSCKIIDIELKQIKELIL